MVIRLMQPLVRKEWREGRWKRLIAWPLFVLLGAGVPLFYGPTISILQEQAGALPFDIEALPESLQYANYAVNNWMKSMYETLVILAVVFGAASLAGEFSRGTITLLWTRPIPRSYVAYAKWVVDISILAGGALLHTVATDVFSRALYDTALPPVAYLALLPTLAGTAVIYGVAMFFSGRSEDPIRAGAWAAATALIMSVPTWFAQLRWASVYVQMTVPALLSSGRFPWGSFLALLVLALALLIGTCRTLVLREA